MLRHNQRRSSNERNGNPDQPAKQSGLQLKRKKWGISPQSSRSYKSTLKRVVAIEAVFLHLAWGLFSDRLLSSWRAREGSASLRAANMNHLEQLHAYVDSIKHESEHASFHAARGSREISREMQQERSGERRERRMAVTTGDRMITKEMQHEIDAYKGPTLVIGGSDVSGTRAFVSYMKELGVPMWIEDKQTLDVHGAVMFDSKGWPPLANLVLNTTHSANYEVKQLPNETQAIALREIAKLKDKAAYWERK